MQIGVLEVYPRAFAASFRAPLCLGWAGFGLQLLTCELL